SDEFQKEHRLLNSYLYLEALGDRTIPARLVSKVFASTRRASPVVVVRNYLEQEPQPNNRVTLSAKLDPLGMQKAQVTWDIGESDKKTIRAFHALLTSELPRLGIGEFWSPLVAEKGNFPIITDASHHMGTTRMGTDPKISVVDPHCRVHTMKNLFIAGSSVFPTGGAAGPTATICALAIRLADHLKST